MLNKIRHILIAAVCSLTVTACWDDIPAPEGGDFQPVLCMNADIVAGEKFTVQLTRTRTRLDTTRNNQTSFTVNDAAVCVYFDGRLVAQPKFDWYADEANTLWRGYRCNEAPAPGTCIKITADSPRYGHVEAETTVPMPARLGSVTGTMVYDESIRNPAWGDTDQEFTWGRENMLLSIYVPVGDTPGHPEWFSVYTNAYQRYESDLGYFNLGTLDYESEKIWNEHIDGYESVLGGESYGFTVFSDKSFNGSQYRLHLRYPGATLRVARGLTPRQVLDSLELELYVYSLSQSCYAWEMYNWFSSNSISGDMSWVGLGDMLQPYSNTSTHAGVVTARTKTRVPVDLSRLELVYAKIKP